MTHPNDTPPSSTPPPSWSGSNPPPGWGGPAGSTYVEVKRPGGVTAAAIILIVIGVLATLGGILALLGGALFAGIGADPRLPTGMGGALAGLAAVLGIVILVVGILMIASGVGALQGKEWARYLGIILGVIGAVLTALGLLGTLTGGGQAAGGPEVQGATTGSLILSVIFLVAYIVVVWGLLTGGEWFRARSRRAY